MFATYESRLRFILSCLALLILMPAAAADESKWNVHVWQPNDASPNSIIAGLTQTKDGYLWVGTTTGLARFDGVKFQTTPLRDLYHGEVNRIGVLAPSHDGSLLIAIYHGPV